MYENVKKNSPKLDEYFVYYYVDNIRKSKDKMQVKDVRKKKYITKITYYENTAFFIPYTRTESVEYNSAIPDLNTLKTIINRRVIYNEKLIDEKIMRVALEMRSDELGLDYSITAEVEYDQLTFNIFSYNKIVEDAFFKKFVDLYMYELIELRTRDIFKFQELELSNYGHRVFQQLNSHYTSSSHEIIVYKLDGYKCKFGMKDGVLYYHDAVMNFCSGYCNFLRCYDGVVFQGELMENNIIYVTDILGGFVGNGTNLYMPQPLEVISFFSWLKVNLSKMYFLTEPYELILNNKSKLTKFHVYFQHEYHEKKVEVPIDGYIVIQNANIFKFKVPSFDVVVDRGYLKVKNKVEPISNKKFPDLIDGAIYEVQEKPDHSISILKIRFDRREPVDYEVFLEYKKELSFMRSVIKASSSEDSLKRLEKIKEMFSACRSLPTV